MLSDTEIRLNIYRLQLHSEALSSHLPCTLFENSLTGRVIHSKEFILLSKDNTKRTLSKNLHKPPTASDRNRRADFFLLKCYKRTLRVQELLATSGIPKPNQ